MSGQPISPDETPILLGTRNPAKQDMLRWLVGDLPLSPATPRQLGLETVPEEEGDTHEAIAKTKASDWSKAASMLAIASDGGLVLPALGSRWESRYTHRFAGPEADDTRRQERLLQLMQPYHGARREATWVEAVAIADRGRVLASWELKGATGVIVDSIPSGPRASGFWAFAVWYFPDLGKTYSQLSSEEWERLEDHWVRLRPIIQDFFHRHLELPH